MQVKLRFRRLKILIALMISVMFLNSCGTKINHGGEANDPSENPAAAANTASPSSNENPLPGEGNENSGETPVPGDDHSSNTTGKEGDPAGNPEGKKTSGDPDGSKTSGEKPADNKTSNNNSSNNSANKNQNDPPPNNNDKPVQAVQPDQSAPLKKFVKTPEAPGVSVETSSEPGENVIDYSNASEGYVMLKSSGAGKIKAYITAPNGINYQYDFESNGNFIVCPLQGGNGNYTIQIMENVSGSSYRSLIKVETNVSIANANLPFLYPNYKVNFSSSSQCVNKAAELTRGMTADLHKIEAIYNYIVENIKYDKAKASSVQSGYNPNPDRALQEGKGICSDYSSLAAAMLRSQNIPVKMVEGNVAPNNVRHAWNLIYTKEKGVIAAKIEFNGSWKIVDTTFGASLGSGVDQYIGNGSSYTEDKCY